RHGAAESVRAIGEDANRIAHADRAPTCSARGDVRCAAGRSLFYAHQRPTPFPGAVCRRRRLHCAAAQRACRTTRGVRTCPPPLEREATTRLPVLGAGLAIRRHGSRTLSRPAGVSHSRRSLRQTIARPL